jgi:8-amino-7-oxononanoate synthase
MRTGETWIAGELETRRQDGMERTLTTLEGTGPHLTVGGRSLLNVSNNDYLGLARHPHVVATARAWLERLGAGATASRLVTGSLTCHDELEERLARAKGYPAALVFGSGYAANLGLVTAVAGRGDHLFIDRLAHASLVDAAVLSRAVIHRFRHNDAGHLESLLQACRAGGRRLVLTESVFSMDGDLAPLGDLAEAAGRHDAMLLVDEAHATGVFGPGGCGCVRTASLEDRVNLSMGTLSKALGSQGGFTACSTGMRALLINNARSFIYSTALAPAAAGAAIGALDVLEREPGLGDRLLARAATVRNRLHESGLDTGASASQIIPVIVGDTECALRVMRRLRDAGILAVAIRPPTVPAGTARIRLSITLEHSDADLAMLTDAVVEAVRQEA